MKTLKKPLSLLMALFMCLGMFAGTGVTAFAAGETMTTYMVDIPRANDPNKAGWGHPALNFLGGWSTSAGTHFSVHTQAAYIRYHRFSSSHRPGYQRLINFLHHPEYHFPGYL